MKLIIRETNKEFEAEIIEVNEDDFLAIRKSGQFGFNWDEEQQYQVFKIVKENEENPVIHGLISLIDISNEMRIHISLIENSNDNKGKNKKIDRVAGCLLAFAAGLAYQQGYEGFTSLVPKTGLIGLYVNKYGFSQYGRQLAIEKNDAIQLIQKYL